MYDLNARNVKTCVSFLREFIEDSPAAADKKRVAALALDHLQHIKAGTGSLPSDYTDPKCNGRPRAG